MTKGVKNLKKEDFFYDRPLTGKKVPNGWSNLYILEVITDIFIVLGKRVTIVENCLLIEDFSELRASYSMEYICRQEFTHAITSRRLRLSTGDVTIYHQNSLQ